MSGKIFVMQGDESLRSLSEQDFVTEDDFQSLLEKYPDLLPGEQIDPVMPRRWLLVSREYGVPDEENATDRWALDHLFLDQDGIPTLVEVKRRSDARLTNTRREVVGQMLDYAANAVVYWPVETMRARFEAGCEARGESDLMKLIEFLDLDTHNGDEYDDAIQQFWEKVKLNLQASRLRLLFVADFIPPELRRIVEFLNANMNSVEVLAVEIKHFVGTDANGAILRTLVPRVFGQSAQAEQKKAAPRTQPTQNWNEEMYFEGIEAQRDEAQVSRTLLDWAKKNELSIVWGKGITSSFSVRLTDARGHHSLFAVYGSSSIEFGFQYMRKQPPFTDDGLRETWRRKLNEIEGVRIDENPERPNIPLTSFLQNDKLQQLLIALDWALEQIRKP
jgi:hypothetical protein